MLASDGAALDGRRLPEDPRVRWTVVVAALFLGTYASYSLGVVQIGDAGGVVFPRFAAALGLLVAGWLGYAGGRLAVAWAVAYAPLLGYFVFAARQWAPVEPLPDQLLDFFGPLDLVLLGAEAAVLGVGGFAVGYVLQWSAQWLRGPESVGDAPGRR